MGEVWGQQPRCDSRPKSLSPSTSGERAGASSRVATIREFAIFPPAPRAVRAGTRACEGCKPSRSPMRKFNRVLWEPFSYDRERPSRQMSLINHLYQKVSLPRSLEIQCRLQSQVTLVQSGTALLPKCHAPWWLLDHPKRCIDNDMPTPEGGVILRYIRRGPYWRMGGQV